jgi:integrase
LAKDYFLMSFYLMGVSFVDLAFLTHENIVDSRIEYTRRKTGQLHSIKITEPLETLLGRYLIKNAGSGTLLGVVKGRTEEARYTQARDELRRYNRSLKQLGEMVGLSAPITSYTARHSYATIAKSKNVPVAVISEALGHETIEMTQTYLAEFETDVLDRYNEVIIAM